MTINIKFPLEDDVVLNRFLKMNQITKDAITSNLLLLLLTEKGERYYLPDYGTNLLKFLFEPNDNITASDIEEEIKETVSRYMPNITITEVLFNRNFDDDGNRILETQLNIKIRFNYIENTLFEAGEIDLSF